ncbi:Gustatory receptor 8 [Cephus cinctus]|uniref:Gustatory receptor n=2 Tax=Cephus cinctus TaxID=211228 RepID=A0A3L9LTS5_CEPCN|nr:uncharacterized protein LOC107274875 isoform X1 [Cephus cinctus]RLZ02139.1 Gustatory receptor 8 [Cephus cinctus]
MLKKCKLFRARDLVSLMGPCFLLCRFYGFFPYKIKSNNREIAYSKWRFIYSFTAILTYILLTTYISIRSFDTADKLKYYSVPRLIQVNLYLLLTTLICILSLFYMKTKLKLLQQLNAISWTFTEKNFIRMSRVVHGKDIFGIFILSVQASNIYSLNNINTAHKCLLMYSIITVYALDMLYVNCVYVLRVGFKNINENLHGLRRYVITDKPHLLPRVNHQCHNPIILLELKALEERHHTLSEAVRQLNNGFGFHVGTTLVLTFTELIFSVYFVILRQVGNVESHVKKNVWLGYSVMCIFYYSVKLFAIVWTCEATKNEALRTGNLIHEMLIDTADFDVKYELQTFSLQLLHSNNTFDAKGTVIDARLLKGIFGGVATHLFILIQFLLSSKK